MRKIVCKKNVVAFEKGYEEILNIIPEGESCEIDFRLA